MVRFGDCSAQIEWLHCQWQKCRNPWTALDAIVRQQLTSGQGNPHTHAHTSTHVPVCVCVCVTDRHYKVCKRLQRKNVHKFSFYASGVWRVETERGPEGEGNTQWHTGKGVCRQREGGLRKPVSKFHVDNNVRKLNCELFRAVHSCSCRFRATTLVSFLGRCSFEKEKLFNRPSHPSPVSLLSEDCNHAVASAEIELGPRII